MRWMPALFVLIVGGCGAQEPAAAPSPGRAADRDASVAAPPSPPPAPPDGSQALGPEFPFVRVWTQTSFAHDHGDMTTIERVEVAGEPCPPGEVLARIVAHWNGWTPEGGRADADVLRTTQAFVEAWDGHLEARRLTDDTAPDDLVYLLRGVGGLRGSPGAPALAYHPPRYELREEGGERLVVASYFVRGHVSQRGQHWRYRVSAFRVRDGERHAIAADSTLPQPRSFSEGG